MEPTAPLFSSVGHFNNKLKHFLQSTDFDIIPCKGSFYIVLVFIWLFLCICRLSIFMSMSVYLSVRPSICLSVSLSICLFLFTLITSFHCVFSCVFVNCVFAKFLCANNSRISVDEHFCFPVSPSLCFDSSFCPAQLANELTWID